MGTYSNGVMGPFNGKVGTVVGYMWNGKFCMRAYQKYVKNPRTEAQTAHRQMFKQEVQLAAKMRRAVAKTLRDSAREEGLTAYNLFVKLNQRAFGMEEGRLTVDYSALTLSVGDVPPVEPRGMEWSADNVLEVRFSPTGAGSRYDLVYLYVYVPDLESGYLAAPVHRRDKRLAVALPDEYAGHQAQAYLMVQADDGRWSLSAYAGEIVFNELLAEEDETEDSLLASGKGATTEGGMAAGQPTAQSAGRPPDGGSGGGGQETTNHIKR